MYNLACASLVIALGLLVYGFFLFKKKDNRYIIILLSSIIMMGCCVGFTYYRHEIGTEFYDSYQNFLAGTIPTNTTRRATSAPTTRPMTSAPTLSPYIVDTIQNINANISNLNNLKVSVNETYNKAIATDKFKKLSDTDKKAFVNTNLNISTLITNLQNEVVSYGNKLRKL